MHKMKPMFMIKVLSETHPKIKMKKILEDFIQQKFIINWFNLIVDWSESDFSVKYKRGQYFKNMNKSFLLQRCNYGILFYSAVI